MPRYAVRDGGSASNLKIGGRGPAGRRIPARGLRVPNRRGAGSCHAGPPRRETLSSRWRWPTV